MIILKIQIKKKKLNINWKKLLTLHKPYEIIVRVNQSNRVIENINYKKR